MKEWLKLVGGICCQLFCRPVPTAYAMNPDLSRPRAPRFAGDPHGEDGEAPSTPPKSRRKILSPANWVAGAVRQLKKGEKTNPFAEVDAAFNFAARLDGVDQAQVDASSCLSKVRDLETAIFFLGSKMDELFAKSDSAASNFTAATAESLHQNNLTLNYIIERVGKLEGRMEEGTLNSASLKTDILGLREHVHIEYPSQSDRLAAVEGRLNTLSLGHGNVERSMRELDKKFKELEHDHLGLAASIDRFGLRLRSLDAKFISLAQECNVKTAKVDDNISELFELIPRGASTTVDELQEEVFRINEEIGLLEMRLQKWVTDEVSTRFQASDIASRSSPLPPAASGGINVNLVHLLPQLAPSASIELISGFADTCRLRYLGQLWRMNATDRVLEVHKGVSSVQAGRHTNPTVATMAEAWRRIITEWDLGVDMVEPELYNVCPAQTSARNEALILKQQDPSRGRNTKTEQAKKKARERKGYF